MSRHVAFLGALVSALFLTAISVNHAPADEGQIREHRGARPIAGTYRTDEIIIKFKSNASNSEKDQIRAELGGSKIKGLGRIKAELRRLGDLTVEEAIDRYQNNPKIDYIEPNYIVEALEIPDDPLLPQLYAMQNTGQTGGTPGADISATSAWDVFTGSSQVVVGVIDTGVNYLHPDLAANIFTNPDEIPNNGIDDDANGFIDDVRGWDFINNDNDPMDDNSHGSHCSGTIGAVGDNGIGVVGVNWTVRILPLKFLSAGGSGTTADAVDAVNYAVMMHNQLNATTPTPMVLSNSWGGGGFSQALLDAIEDAGNNGILFIAAAGNSGVNTDFNPHYPSSYAADNIVSVAATDHNDQLAVFSNFGVVTVDLAAPGVNTLSTILGSSYGTKSGTSMATPHVAGVFGLVYGRFPSIDAMDAKSLVLDSADPLPNLSGVVLTGARLNAFMAIADPDTIPPAGITDLTTVTAGSNWLVLNWTATGDDSTDGTASRYIVKYSTSPIDETNFDAANTASGPPDPGPAGTAESMQVNGLVFSTDYYFAAKALDEFGNTGPVSNIAMGTTLGAPDADVDPTSLTETLLVGATSTQNLTLSNLAEGTLDFVIPLPELVTAPQAQAAFLEVGKGVSDPRTGVPVTEGSGGPDGFGYRWVDSDDPFGPTFNWTDISGTGSVAIVSGDDVNSGPFAIGFPFSFYGVQFNQVRICSNGFLSFTSTSSAFTNQPLPNASAPLNLVAPFWEDLYLSSGSVYYENDGSRFIVQWQNVDNYNGGGPYTFQAILHPNGTIVFQYLSMGIPTDQATVGIQNGTGTDALQMAFNTSYVHNNLAIRMGAVPQWLTVSPGAGTVLAGGSTTLDVDFNVAGLLGGTYEANINIQTNDPNDPALTVPVTMTVIGAPDIDVTPTSFDFGQVFVGGMPTTTIFVNNPGTDTLHVSGISIDDAAYTPDLTVFPVPPQQHQAVEVTFAPGSVALYPATMTINSDDPDEPSVTVALAGEGLAAPVIGVTPTSLTADLFTGETSIQTITIENTGGNPLEFAVKTEAVEPGGMSVADAVASMVDRSGILSGPLSVSGTSAITGETLEQTLVDPGEVANVAYGVGTSSLPDVALISGSDPSWTDDVQAKLVATGRFGSVTKIAGNAVTPTLAELQAFSAVMVWSSLPYLDQVALGNNLADYVDDGGGVVCAIFEVAVSSGFPLHSLQGRWASEQYYVVERSSHQSGTHATLGVVSDPNHPTMDGVTSFDGGSGSWRGTTASLTPGSTMIASWSDGTALVAVKTIGTSNRVDLGFYPPSSDIRPDFWQANTDGDLLMANSLEWAGGGVSWLSADPAEGSVAPGSSVDVGVTFDATGLNGGAYDANVLIENNDPVASLITVPAHLDVTGAPDLLLSAAALDYGSVFIGSSSDRILVVSNVGTDDLIVTSITSDDSDYSVDITNFTLNPGDTAAVTVSFAPTNPVPIPAVLSIASNDPDTPTATVNLNGVGLIPPDIGVSPTSMEEALLTNEMSTQTLTIDNTGGSDLYWEIGLRSRVASYTLTVPEPTSGSTSFDGEVNVHMAPPVRTTAITADLGDLTGVEIRWDRSHGQFPSSDWSTIIADVTARGANFEENTDPITPALLADIDILWTVDSFGWTGAEISAVSDWVLNGGGLIIESDQAVTDMNNLLSLMGAGIQFAFGGGSAGITTNIFDHETTQDVNSVQLTGPVSHLANPTSPGGLLVSDTNNVPNSAFSAPGSGRVVVVSDEIFYNYAISQADNQLFANQVVDWLAGPSFLTVSPNAGTVSAGASVDVDVNFDATGLFGGDYYADVVVRSNDPDEPEVVVPTHLNVTGVPDIALSETALAFGQVFVGSSSDLMLMVHNMGTDTLHVSDVSADNPDYAASIASFNLAPGDTEKVTVTFTPANPVPSNGTLTVTSDDPDTPSALVPLTGEGLIPPDIGVDPLSLTENLLTNQTSTQMLTVSNTGGSDLNYSISLRFQNGQSGSSDPPPDVISTESNSTSMTGTTERKNGYDRPMPSGQADTYRMLEMIIANTPAEYVVFFDDMESGLNGWTTEAYGVDDLWHRTTRAYNSATTSWWCGIESQGNYETFNRINTAAVSPEISLVGLQAPVTLEFFETYETESGWDYCMVDVSTDGGQNWTPLRGSWGQAPSGSSGGWIMSMLDLSDYAGETINLRFYFDTGDGAINAYPGWFFDDVMVVAEGLPFVSVDPSSGTVPAGSSADLTVTFDATGLVGGDYDADLVVASNDPDESEVPVHAHLHVTGVPDIQLSDSAIDFGTLFLGDYRDEVLTVANIGTDDLVVTDVSIDNPDFTADKTVFTLAPGEDQEITLTFLPASVGVKNATVSIDSNDPDTPTATASLTGEAVVPPIATLDPTSVESNLFTNDMETQQVTIGNDGGSDLVFVIDASTPPPPPTGPKVAVHTVNHTAKWAGVCNPPPGPAPVIPCSEYNVSGGVGVGHDVYMVVAGVDPNDGVLGLSCGLDYNGAPLAGVDVFSWQFCGSGLEFRSDDPEWPEAGSGNRMTWIIDQDCQNTVIPPDGVHAVAGAFYVYAYSPDTFSITPNNTVGQPEFEFANCEGATIPIPTTAAGSTRFSSTGTVPGYNPCLGGVQVYEDPAPAEGIEDSRLGTPVAQGMGGPDTFGHRWIDSDEPDGPTFDWVNIAGVGTLIPMQGDNANSGPIPIGFSFPFYGNAFTEFRVCTNGWISFTSNSSYSSNQPLPASFAPENALAVFWDDLYIPAPSVYYYNDGSRLIIQYQGVYRDGGSGPYTFQVILSPTGTILYQYLNMFGIVNSATIGIQNDTRNDGLTVVFNNYYVHNNLAVRIDTQPQWLSVDPPAGTVLPGQTTLLNVGLDATGLFGGQYTADIHINTNDPANRRMQLPVTLNVTSAPDISFSAGNLDFGEVYIGYPENLGLQVTNLGVETLTVTSITSGLPDYSVSLPSFNVSPQQSINIVATFDPQTAGERSTSLTFVSNDPHSPHTVDVTGIGVVPPVISVSPDTTLGAALVGGSKTKTLTVSNTGGSDLVWVLEGAPAPTGEPKIALHMKNHATKGQCNPQQMPVNTPCSQYDTEGDLQTPYDVYLVVAQADMNGVSGLSFGIDYNDAIGQGVDVGYWYFCASGLEFPSDGWPGAGSGARMTWLLPDDCQDTVIDPDGVHAIAGAFYMYAYGSDSFSVTPNFTILGTPELRIATCDVEEIDLPTSNAGSVSFSPGEAAPGYNPCVDEGNASIPAWLNVNPTSGTVPLGQSLNLTVVMDADALSAGDYTSSIDLGSNDPANAHDSTPVIFHVGSVDAADFDVDPNTLNLGSNGMWVVARVELPTQYDPQDVLVETVRLNGVVEADLEQYEIGDFNENGIPDLTFRFDRVAVEAILPEGDSVPITVTGEIEDTIYFTGTEYIRSIRPQLLSPNGGETFIAGTINEISWDNPNGWNVTSATLTYSGDGGATWSLVADNITQNSYLWTAPAATEEAMIRVYVYDDLGILGHDDSDEVFTVSAATGIDNVIPTAHALFQNAPNPFMGSSRIVFDLPEDSNVTLKIFDINGRILRVLEDGWFPTGRHETVWDARDGGGRRVAAGIYFYRLEAGTFTASRRMSVID